MPAPAIMPKRMRAEARFLPYQKGGFEPLDSGPGTKPSRMHGRSGERSQSGRAPQEDDGGSRPEFLDKTSGQTGERVAFYEYISSKPAETGGSVRNGTIRFSRHSADRRAHRRDRQRLR